jgi:hypothetical protein
VGHSTLVGVLQWPFGVVGLLLYLFILTGVPNVEHLSRRARFAAACRRSPWLTGIALLFLAGGSFAQSSTSCDSFLYGSSGRLTPGELGDVTIAGETGEATSPRRAGADPAPPSAQRVMLGHIASRAGQGDRPEIGPVPLLGFRGGPAASDEDD